MRTRSRFGSTIWLVCGLVLLLAACAEPSGLDADDLTAAFVDGGVRIENHGREPAYFIVVNARSLALWAICEEGPDACPAVPPGGAVVVPVDAILGWEGDPEADAAQVRFWSLVADGRGGWRAGDVHLLDVRR